MSTKKMMTLLSMLAVLALLATQCAPQTVVVKETVDGALHACPS